MGAVIYHVAYLVEWEDARAAGRYERSTRGRSLADVGFIHASRADQVDGVANAFYAGEDGLVVLAVEERRLRADVRWEAPPGSAETFPHVYGPLPVDAVVDVLPLRPGPDGRFHFRP
jgi:glutathione S-transferase